MTEKFERAVLKVLREHTRLLEKIYVELKIFNEDEVDFKEPPGVASEELQAALDALESSQGISIGEFLYHVNTEPDDEEKRRFVI